MFSPQILAMLLAIMAHGLLRRLVAPLLVAFAAAGFGAPFVQGSAMAMAVLIADVEAVAEPAGACDTCPRSEGEGATVICAAPCVAPALAVVSQAATDPSAQYARTVIPSDRLLVGRISVPDLNPPRPSDIG